MNCYPICRYYYYFNNSNKYFCTEDEKCPKEYITSAFRYKKFYFNKKNIL